MTAAEPGSDRGDAGLGGLSHIGVAVKDVEAAARLLSSISNTASVQPFDYSPRADELLAGGEFAIRIAFIEIGSLTIELIEPLDDHSIWARFIAERGEGIHHVAFEVSSYDKTVALLSEQRYKALVGAVYEGWRWCYFDTSASGMIIELVEEHS